MNKIFIFLVCCSLFSCGHKKYDNPHVLITTNMGEIEVELFPKQAPKTVAAFLAYVDSGLYNNSSFYRVLKMDDMAPEYNTGLIQGGIWKTNSTKAAQLKGIVHEPTSQTHLSHTNGTVSLARLSPGSGTSEFFICIGNQRQFDKSNSETGDSLGFAAFGKVVKGMTIVRKIQSKPSHGDHFDEQIIIKHIERM
jgi:peptidyl-prolyl cis-trans isomerase A (cyclophilin A)